MTLVRPRNSAFWEKEQRSCNCGSFAFDLTRWYDPYENFFERIEWIMTMHNDGWSRAEIMKILLDTDSNYMQNEFDELVEISEEYALTAPAAEKIIAYRISVKFDDWAEDESDYDCDFHFKIRIDGQWYEKNGSHPPHACELAPDTIWEYTSGEPEFEDDEPISYDSPIKYFVIKEV